MPWQKNMQLSFFYLADKLPTPPGPTNKMPTQHEEERKDENKDAHAK